MACRYILLSLSKLGTNIEAENPPKKSITFKENHSNDHVLMGKSIQYMIVFGNKEMIFSSKSWRVILSILSFSIQKMKIHWKAPMPLSNAPAPGHFRSLGHFAHPYHDKGIIRNLVVWLCKVPGFTGTQRDTAGKRGPHALLPRYNQSVIVQKIHWIEKESFTFEMLGLEMCGNNSEWGWEGGLKSWRCFFSS